MYTIYINEYIYDLPIIPTYHIRTTNNEIYKFKHTKSIPIQQYQ